MSILSSVVAGIWLGVFWGGLLGLLLGGLYILFDILRSWCRRIRSGLRGQKGSQHLPDPDLVDQHDH